jgi:putative oxidoreductase
MKDFALLLERLAFGGLMAGHGAQKLFGVFGGGGIKGTEGMMKAMNMQPPKPWAIMAGLSEFGGGTLTALGALNPIGPLGTIAAMSMATAKAHWGKPIWNTKGGAELPVLNIAAALALGLVGPGQVSVDNALGIKLPRRLIIVPGLAVVAASVAYGVMASMRPQPEEAQEQSSQQGKPEEQVQSAAQSRENEQAVRVPESPEDTEVPEPHVVLNDVGLEQLTDERIEAGQSNHHPA